MDYTRAGALIVRRGYDYDILGRPTARNLARYGTETSDTFGYNTRSELTSAHVNSADYSYAYDAIGNRTSAVENGTSTAYNAKNRPVLFVKSDNSVTVECTYDTMGRRATKKVTTNGSVTEHRCFFCFF